MSSVTIFVQGHGSEDINKRITGMDNVELLSFSGLAGEPGRMAMCADESGTFRGVDMLCLEKIKERYTGNETQENNIQLVAPELEALYNRCGIQYKRGGFTLTKPIRERTFFFEPNPHEDCAKCIETGNERCIPKRNPVKRYCPEYGIVVVDSTDESDYGFTLSTSRGTQKSNLLMNNTTLEHYYRKSNANDKNFIREVITYYKQIELTMLVRFFKSMGFEHIYILDPTCRDIGDGQNLRKIFKTQVQKVIEQNKYRENPRPVTTLADTVAKVYPLEKDVNYSTEVGNQYYAEKYDIQRREKAKLKLIDAGKMILCVAGVCLYVAAVKSGYLPLGGGVKKKRQRTYKNRKTNKTYKRH